MRFQLKLLRSDFTFTGGFGNCNFLVPGICRRAEPLQSGQVGATGGGSSCGGETKRGGNAHSRKHTNALHTHARSQTSYMRHRSGNGSNPTSNSLSSRLVDRGKQTDPRQSEWGFTN